MSVDKNSLPARQNRLLAALPATEYERLIPHLKLVSLALNQIIYEAQEPITQVYFPLQSVISIVSTMENGSTVEVGLVSNEGMVGIPAILGGNSTTTTAVVQIPDGAMRMNADVLKTMFDEGGPLQTLLLRYIQARFTETTQGCACNRLHTLDERLARWLLTVSDRLQSEEFPLTQEFISQMLGVRRSGVTVAARSLSQAGMISYHRGQINILNREALEATSCECYRVIRDEFARLLENYPLYDSS